METIPVDEGADVVNSRDKSNKGDPREEADAKIAILPEEKNVYICRYGSGCTHMKEKDHTSLFWHPPVPKLDKRTLRTHYICNECGHAFLVLQELQQHLQGKTAWSNRSLMRARLNVFLDGQSWQEGIVTSFRGGKHRVNFYIIGEKRWLSMNKTLFYIIYQPNDFTTRNTGSGDVKVGDDDHYQDENDKWIYVEDISLDYAFTQSVLFKVYGSSIQETGYRTRGHISLTETDQSYAQTNKGSFLYGELLPRGVDKAFRQNRLNAASARTLYDLGMGIGKVVMQAFLQFRNLIYVYGVELSQGRFRIAEEAVIRMVNLLGKESFSVEHVPGKSIMVIERDLAEDSHPIVSSSVDSNDPVRAARGSATTSSLKKRVLHMVQGDLLLTPHIQCADIVMLETDFPPEIHPDLCSLLSNLKQGARSLTYLDLRKLFGDQKNPLFCQLDINKASSDRYQTSWSMQRGHRFYLWKKEVNSVYSVGSIYNSHSRKRSSTEGNAIQPLPVLSGHSENSEYSRDVTYGISQQLDLCELAACEKKSIRANGKSRKISTFFSKIFSAFKRNTGPDWDHRVVPIKSSSFNIAVGQKPSRRHSRGHTEDALGMSRDDLRDPSDVFPIPEDCCRVLDSSRATFELRDQRDHEHNEYDRTHPSDTAIISTAARLSSSNEEVI